VPQECPPIKIGTIGINHPAQPNEDLMRLQGKGVPIFAVLEDLEERGLSITNCMTGVRFIHRNDIALLMDDYDQVWHW
jgi:hypothetical protein